MTIDFLLERFQENSDQPAIIWQDETINYTVLLDKYQQAKAFLGENNIVPGDIVSLTGDFTPNTIALLLALIGNNNIVVPFNSPIKDSETIKFEIAQVEKGIIVNLDTDEYAYEKQSGTGEHAFFKQLRELKHPGLVLFTS